MYLSVCTSTNIYDELKFYRLHRSRQQRIRICNDDVRITHSDIIMTLLMHSRQIRSLITSSIFKIDFHKNHFLHFGVLELAITMHNTAYTLYRVKAVYIYNICALNNSPMQINSSHTSSVYTLPFHCFAHNFVYFINDKLFIEHSLHIDQTLCSGINEHRTQHCFKCSGASRENRN